ncbi:amidase [Salinisphaera sp. PC39]|uniref:amidase n=1 Tax=Salinisphaera sp. PC39 TaxID=1304156 RepID=UPI00334218C6
MTEIHELGAAGLAAAIRDRRIGCREALEHYLERDARLNPAINAIVARDPDGARARADAADAALARGETTGALHGVPMTIKDTYEVAGMTTVCGEPSLREHRPRRNAVAVQRLIDAGAVVFGKTNTPRMAQDIQTYNRIFGTTGNPWDTARTPGGSSGGSAAATAAGLTALELGSDIGGSIRTPAHWCGVYGHKPSHGIVPLEGHIPGPPGTVAEPDLAVGGPLARSAADLALAFDTLAGPDAMRGKGWRLALPPARRERLADFRVACWFDDAFCPVDADTRRLLERAAAALGNAGARVDSAPTPPAALREEFELYERLLDAVIGAGLPGKLYTKARRGAALMRLLGRTRPATLGGFLDAATQRHKQWAVCHERRERRRREWERFFGDHDVLLMPVTPTPAIPHAQDGNLFSRRIDVDGRARPYFDQFVWIAPATSALLPVTVAPLGTTQAGLPVGVQIVGPYLEDRTTLAFARLLAEHVGGFVAPPDYKED